MPAIPFTQYVRPDGRRRDVSIDMPADVAAKAALIMAHGFCFEIEVLTSGDLSMTVSDDYDDYDCRVCANGAAVPVNVINMILGFDIAEAERQRLVTIDES